MINLDDLLWFLVMAIVVVGIVAGGRALSRWLQKSPVQERHIPALPAEGDMEGPVRVPKALPGRDRRPTTDRLVRLIAAHDQEEAEAHHG